MSKLVAKYHLHIYKVVEMAETDILAYNEGKAKEIALFAAEEDILDFKESDCKLIALAFDVSSGKETKNETNS